MENIIFKKATLNDVDKIMEIIEASKIIQRSQNNYQWNEKYPVHEHIIEDINNDISYVLKNHDDEILATVALPVVNDEFYTKLKNKDIHFMMISRLAINTSHHKKGYGSFLMNEIQKVAEHKNVSYMKGSTNSNNIGMKRLFEKFKFRKTGFFQGTQENGYYYWYEKDLNLYKNK